MIGFCKGIIKGSNSTAAVMNDEDRRHLRVTRIKEVSLMAATAACVVLFANSVFGAEVPEGLAMPGQPMPALTCGELAKSVIKNRQAAGWPMRGAGPNGLVPDATRPSAVLLAAQLAAVDLELARSICKPDELSAALVAAAGAGK